MAPVPYFRFAVLVLVLGLGGRSAQSGSVGEPPGSNQKLAGSLAELFQQARSAQTNPYVVSVLDRAIETGSIQQADYDEAHRRYLQCMNDSGIEVTATKLANGLYDLVLPDLSDPELSQRFRRVVVECSTELAPIEALYRVQIGNPELLSDNFQVAVSCLKREGLVDATYTVEKLKEDLASRFEHAAFNPMSSAAQLCFSGAGMAVVIGPR